MLPKSPKLPAMADEQSPGCDALVAEAGQLYEDDDFAGAARAYRAAALLAPLPNPALVCLVYAQREEAIDLCRQAARAFPDSIEAALTEIEALADARHRRQAIARCSEWLERPGLTEQEIRQFRGTRFQVAAERSIDPATIAADFAYLWNWPSLNRERVRLNLLRTLTALNEPQMIDALNAIRDRFADDANLSPIIATKIEQLSILARIKSALPPIRRRASDGESG